MDQQRAVDRRAGEIQLFVVVGGWQQLRLVLRSALGQRAVVGGGQVWAAVGVAVSGHDGGLVRGAIVEGAWMGQASPHDFQLYLKIIPKYKDLLTKSIKKH